MGKAGESTHEKVADGSTPGTRGEDGAALGEDNGRSHVDGDSIDYVLPAKVSPHSYRGSMLLIRFLLSIERLSPAQATCYRHESSRGYRNG